MSHHHGRREIGDGALDRRLWLAAALNVGITLAEVAGGLLAGSLALLSDAAHNLSDVAAVVVALLARRLGRRPPTARHSYGFRRVEVVAALGNAVLLIAVTALIAREALHRLLHPAPVARGILLAVGLVALAANVGSVLLLRRHDEGDLNVRSAFVLAALLARTPVGPWVDPAAALLVGLVVLRSALSLAWQTLTTLLEGTPHDVDIEELAGSVGRAFAPACLHHVHVWEIGPRQRLLTAHLALGQEMEGRAIEALLGKVKSFLKESWRIDHATIEPEILGCEQPSLLGSWDLHA